jgi:hypothetical protein
MSAPARFWNQLHFPLSVIFQIVFFISCNPQQGRLSGVFLFCRRHSQMFFSEHSGEVSGRALLLKVEAPGLRILRKTA